MKLALALLLIPALAFADKSFVDNKDATWDCAKDPDVSILGNRGVYELKGTCKKVVINGNHDTVKVESAERIVINGNYDAVTAATVAALEANGNNNTVKAKNHVTDISNLGTHNTIDVGHEGK